MNSCISDWNFEGDLPSTNQKKPSQQDHELVELLWRNGQVVMHSQTNRKQGVNPNESRQVQKHDQMRVGGFYGNSSDLIHGDEEAAVSMLQYPLDDSFDKEFCSHFFSELPSCDPFEIEKPIKQFGDEKSVNVLSSSQTNVKFSTGVPCPENPMPPPRFQISNPTQKNQNGGLGKVVNFSQFSALGKSDIGSPRKQMRLKEPGMLDQAEVRECSVVTVGSSYSGSNQLPNEFDVSRASSNVGGPTLFSTGNFYNNVQKTMPSSEGGMTETLDPTLTSSSGGSGSSFGRGKQSNVVNSNKRKGRYAKDSEYQSETATETESATGNKPVPRSGSSRRTRAAEVHNLSERRRRDRINEKMKTLQELIPHSNKTDKASMLDEAIEYLQSLQLQLQAMWMGGGRTPMMFPGVQHYMSRMGMGPSAMPSMHNPMQLPRVPMVDQCMTSAVPTNPAVMCQTPVLNPADFHNQMQNPSFQEQYARLMGFHHLQTMSPPMNMFRFGSQPLPQNQMMAPTGMNTSPLIGGAAMNEDLSGKMKLLPGGHGLMVRGHRPVINTLAKGLDIRLGHRVTKVVWRHNGVKVTIEDGKSFIADAAIIAVPLGVLKANLIKFEPKLPDWKETAIAELGVGIENKIVLHFEKVFWPNVAMCITRDLE